MPRYWNRLVAEVGAFLFGSGIELFEINLYNNGRTLSVMYAKQGEMESNELYVSFCEPYKDVYIRKVFRKLSRRVKSFCKRESI